MRIEPVGLETEMQRSYLDYAMSVIVSRALPDVRDGLKPVHRRVLYAMYDGGYRPEGLLPGAPAPSATSWATTTRTATPRSTTPWSAWRSRGRCGCRWWTPTETSALGHDPAAAMRYTECKMAPLSMEMVRHRRGDRRLHGQLRRPLPGADRPAGPLPEPADQRLGRHRGRHGHQHPAATTCARPRRAPSGTWRTRGLARGSLGRAHRAHQRALTSRPAPSWWGRKGHRRGVPHRSWLHHDARGRRGRGRSRTASAWWSPNSRTRSTRTTSRRRSPTLVERRQGRRHRRRP